MSYSGASDAKVSREELGSALAALQEDANVPQDVLTVAQNIAQAVGALFEAERASSEVDGKAAVKSALGSLSQTLALLQDVRAEHAGIGIATEVLAKSMSRLYPLTTTTSRPPGMRDSLPVSAPQGAAAPKPVSNIHAVASSPGALPSWNDPSPPAAAPSPAPAPVTSGDRLPAEANIGATTESNFFVGFSGEISEGGVFLATYDTYPVGTLVKLLVTLPGGFEVHVPGHVRFVRDPMDLTAESEPGMGIAFEQLQADSRELILRFIRKRPPMFYDD